MKQISLSLPESLLKASREYTDEYGYRSVQEMIVDLIRHEVLMKNIERYARIEKRMARGKGVKRMTREQALKYLARL